MCAIRFTVLGAVRAWHGHTELQLGPPQQRAVLALLLAAAGRAGQPVSLSELVDLLWAGDPPSSATNIVHRSVGALRRVLEPGLPPRAAGRWLIRARTPAAGRRTGAAAEQPPSRAVALYLEALGLCQGRLRWRPGRGPGPPGLHRRGP